VTDIVPDYVYTFFANADATGKLTTFAGADETITVDLPVTLQNTAIFYLQTATVYGCTLSPDKVEVQVDVNALTLLPEALPVYEHEQPYRVQLESNAEEPVFTYTGDLPEEMTVSSSGLISGTIPESSGFVEWTFTVTVADKNGCKTQKEITPPPTPDFEDLKSRFFINKSVFQKTVHSQFFMFQYIL
jgi:hypothetical protein